LFCDDHDEHGVPVGYARSFLRRCYPNLSGVFCDNTVFPATWSAELGVPRSLFTVLRFPYDREVVVKADRFEIQGQPRVLWAGRFDRQKRPDILLAIAKAMPAVAFDVHGVADLGSRHPAMDALKALPNVILHGPFTRFEEIVTPDHAAYLFTTSWEGLPTILLDASAAGVPIVAPAVGGVVDLIERSWLVDSPEDVPAFVERLYRLIAEPALRQSRRQQQYAALSRVGGWDTFTAAVNGVGAYLYESPGALVRLSQQGTTT
jgi:glycosyltransferase involved in cell wall biosynthesis